MRIWARNFANFLAVLTAVSAGAFLGGLQRGVLPLFLALVGGTLPNHFLSSLVLGKNIAVPFPHHLWCLRKASGWEKGRKTKEKKKIYKDFLYKPNST
jgi:hypothetical protein